MTLVLSLFPGIGLLDQAFEEEGFTVVRGPDLIWGGDIRRFTPPADVFEGVIGGPPCQRFSGLGKVNIARWGDDSVMPDMIPEFERCIRDALPTWFLMENVPDAPLPAVPPYVVQDCLWNNRWSGGEQDRLRRFSFGHISGTVGRFAPEGVALDAPGRTPTVISTGQNGKGGNRAAVADMARAQGLDPSRFERSPFSTTELRRAIANGVPLPMGRTIAQAVKAALAQRAAA